MNIYEFWRAVLDQDAAAIRGYFHEDACVNWHCTNERFTVDAFIRANCEYPGKWDGTVERVEEIGDLVITATHVFSLDGETSCHVVSFIRIWEGRIIQMDEYWGDDGPAPEWRQDMHIGTMIK